MNDNNILSDKINIKLVYLLTRIVPFSKVFGMASATNLQQFTQYRIDLFIRNKTTIVHNRFTFELAKRPECPI